MTQNHETRQGVYVDCDALWDTRLGTLARLSDDLAQKTLFSGSYHGRERDHFEHADMEAYKTLYAQRDGDTLSHSMRTGVADLVKQLAAALTEQAIARPYHSGPKIVVNLYPYSSTLSGIEKDEIHKVIATWVRLPAEQVELLSLSMEDLTPEFVRASNIAAMFMYDPHSWMEAQSEAFVKTRIPDVMLFGPAILQQAITDQDRSEFLSNSMDPFKATEFLASPLVNLQLLAAEFFSIYTNRHATGTSAQPTAPAPSQELRGSGPG